MLLKVNVVIYSLVPMINGEPQGSVLGPKLFKIVTSDLTSLQVGFLIYADDLNLWLDVNSLDDADRLQATLNMLLVSRLGVAYKPSQVLHPLNCRF